MAATQKQQKEQRDNWSEGMAKFAEAARHNMTAANLATAGAIAIGAAAVAYFWDAGRRNAFMENARRYGGDMGSWWNDTTSASPPVNQ
jgi:hypothetical protein